MKDEEIISYIYGEGDGTPYEEIEEHLRVCPRCFRLFRELKRSAELLDELKREERSVVSDRHLRMFYDKLRKFRARRRLRLALAFSGLILILGSSPFWLDMLSFRGDRGTPPAMATNLPVSISDVEIEYPDCKLVVTLTTEDPDIDIVWVFSEK
ncbi:MAG: hypothetical protein DRJ31_08330 [Candidatus Methanomethylicota archaeon]|uniref:Zinc-finger domain-containing protein n=1 Tax=Thermoproteota archaeon TaxID=2056631 RepID=A0A497ENH3_9CREN|nr:MAG: hypothetical protein DRJ31_08330 [Candidatus Verstraetearchaeota archaeon]